MEIAVWKQYFSRLNVTCNEQRGGGERKRDKEIEIERSSVTEVEAGVNSEQIIATRRCRCAFSAETLKLGRTIQ